MYRQCKERYVRLQKERDYHRMHHRRVAQEKNRLITDVKRYGREDGGIVDICSSLFPLQDEGTLQSVRATAGATQTEIPGHL